MGAECRPLWKADAIAKRNKNQNVLDIKDQVELLQTHLDLVKDTGEPQEVNKCINQLMNLREKYKEITGGLSMYESPIKSLMTKARRVEGVIGDEDREVMIEDIGEDASPRVPGTGPRVLMED